MPELLAAIAGKKRGLFGVTFHGLNCKHDPAMTRKILGKKKGLRFYSKPLIYLAPPDGLEPPT